MDAHRGTHPDKYIDGWIYIYREIYYERNSEYIKSLIPIIFL